jgi:integrase
MASLELRSGRYRIVFRYRGQKYQHALRTRERTRAEALRDRLQANLHDLANGRLSLPTGAELALFLLSDGKVTQKPQVSAVFTFGGLARQYLQAQAIASESSTLKTIAIHLRHIERTLGARFAIAQLTLADLQGHIERRRRQPGRRGPVTGYTIRKEVMTLGAAWTWACQGGLLTGAFPKQGLKYPKAEERSPFQTRAEIEHQLRGEGLTTAARAELWSCLFLTLPEVAEVLDCIRSRARHAFLYPMVCLAAHTGARRSEILNARISDFDLDGGTVLLREKKRVKGQRTTRRVPLSPFLVGVLRDWFAAHPGGPYAFCLGPGISKSKAKRSSATPITRDEAHDHLRRTLEGSPWGVIRGWHIFRHSFVTNCAAAGVDQRLIDAWVGHTTEDMRRRYRHLLPDHSARAIRAVFGQGQQPLVS